MKQRETFGHGAIQSYLEYLRAEELLVATAGV